MGTRKFEGGSVLEGGDHSTAFRNYLMLHKSEKMNQQTIKAVIRRALQASDSWYGINYGAEAIVEFHTL